ncbi:di-trans,poly-cis-decaprenylcistransferase [Candidatus Gottesmanbacteria bacterium RIFCSPLOWO2_02_FULL_42_29]|uniref:Isoprenyl transferase n=2 Tax=Candidatus Gottesmaniibacteriota TaxID=1752720 RepID=A0A1F6BK09_9BACT|nr:MAG: Isoprenyl transferase [Candidatus Gottesmanbacteria bacterium GW2011_GWA2_42_18]KKS73711.1 MAG: Isoprenyl transferase [Candidatus Gottesmanbacteria bacterium GW2011_GWC2_42_8]OGG09109.1 MAG: di-trans,poly-cis-decaprenylcistransferase [Candidatus Gottesmanbacteria bacterium RIFCSPHIGHO2_01_FULL_42_27]OGG21148.1 MAG: di-trans,poly-cis-decaprenylcistransferase [Candidatus Gottesmanbacteria bacterium RIFCSPHIGHO2_12_FULL_43_26]OGG33179.1 MAG: di-trans,poly-cis-decaprenylcistransferase [Cand
MENNLKHIALIMDGNRRWAKKHNLPTLEGHRLGEERIEPLVDCAIEMGISYLTFWAFSTENWHREKREVKFLMKLYRTLLDRKADSFHKKNVRINCIGNLSLFSSDLQAKTKRWMEQTKNNKLITVNLALNYGGKDEIIRAVNKWQKENKKNQELTKDILADYLDSAGQPDPDLIIRTGGEKRLSGFLMWQSEYSELYFTRTYWPDFTPLKFRLAIAEYKRRQRRFGK